MSDYLYFVSKRKNFFFRRVAGVEVIGLTAPGEFFDGIGVFEGALYRGPNVPKQDAWQGRGNYMVARHKADGSADIATDPLGMYPLHLYIKDDTFCISNNAYLLVDTLKKNDISIERSLDVFGYFITQGSGALDATAYKDVYLLETGSRIKITSRQEIKIEKINPCDILYSDRPYSELLASAAEEVTGNIKALANSNFSSRNCDLTGGFDSRTVLAAIVHMNYQDSFFFHTKRNEHNATDVNVASFLRNEFKLRKSVEITGQAFSGSPFQKICRNVSNVRGLFTMNYTIGLRSEENYNNLSFGGGLGELTRHFWRSGQPAGKYRTPLSTVVKNMQGRSDSLVDGLAARQQKLIARFGIDAVSAGIRPEHVGHLLYLKARTKYHFGVWWAASARARFHPLYSPAAIKAAFSLPDEQRIRNRVGLDLMRLLCPRLVEIPFADKSWSPLVHDKPPNPVTEDSLLPIAREVVNEAERTRASDVTISGRSNSKDEGSTTRNETIEDFRSKDRRYDSLSSVFKVDRVERVLQEASEPSASPLAAATAYRILGAYAWANELDLPYRGAP